MEERLAAVQSFDEMQALARDLIEFLNAGKDIVILANALIVQVQAKVEEWQNMTERSNGQKKN
jgi:hypothetical protein